MWILLHILQELKLSSLELKGIPFYLTHHGTFYVLQIYSKTENLYVPKYPSY
jgi:hypothetical protein